jgi:hypothetical protein
MSQTRGTDTEREQILDRGNGELKGKGEMSTMCGGQAHLVASAVNGEDANGRQTGERRYNHNKIVISGQGKNRQEIRRERNKVRRHIRRAKKKKTQVQVEEGKPQGVDKVKQGHIKIAYCNANGKLKSEGENIQDMMVGEGWDIALFTETHIKKEARNTNIPGCKSFYKGRAMKSRKGGGLAMWIKEDLLSYVWQSQDGEEDSNTEKMWLVIQGDAYETALGLIYMSVDSANAEEWNNQLEEGIQADIQAHREAGREIVLIGDFNGHVATNEGLLQGIYESSNRNGRRIEGLVHNNELVILNNILNNIQGKC